jgi:hypothetical protein
MNISFHKRGDNLAAFVFLTSANLAYGLACSMK